MCGLALTPILPRLSPTTSAIVPTLGGYLNSSSLPTIRLDKNDDIFEKDRDTSLFAVTDAPIQMDSSQPKAVIASLVNEEDLSAMLQTIWSLEHVFNEQHGYDWVFFSSSILSQEFRGAICNATKSQCTFEQIEKEFWSIPSSLNATQIFLIHDELKKSGITRKWIENTQHMSRWNSGLFAREKGLQGYDWFWRVKPGVSLVTHRHGIA